MPQSMLISRRKPPAATAPANDQHRGSLQLPAQVAQSVCNLLGHDDDSNQTTSDESDELDQQVAEITLERGRLEAQLELLQRQEQLHQHQPPPQNQRPLLAQSMAEPNQNVDASLNAILYYNLLNLLNQQQQAPNLIEVPTTERVNRASQHQQQQQQPQQHRHQPPAASRAPSSGRAGATGSRVAGAGRRAAGQSRQQQQQSATTTKQQQSASAAAAAEHRTRAKANRMAPNFSSSPSSSSVANIALANDPDSLLQDSQQFYLTSDDLIDDSLLSNAAECKRSSSGSGSGSGDNFVHYCHDCGKSYSTSSNLARHRQTHRDVTDKKAKKCPECDKIYVSMPAFSMHMRTHNQGCICQICGKSFSRPWLLQGHMRTHTGEKPFRCKICDKAFADKSNLRAHIQTHSTTKPHVCGRCNKAFALKSYLCKHVESTCMRANGSQKEPLNLKVLNHPRRNRSNL